MIRAAVLALMVAACAGDAPLVQPEWRTLDPDAREAAFRAAVSARFPSGTTADAIARTLTAEGFLCRDGNRPDGRPVPALECRREEVIQSCAVDWTVELWPGASAPQASAATFCMGASP